VLNFQKQFAQKILKISYVLLAVATTLLIVSFFIHQNYLKHYKIKDSQIKTIERKLINQGLDDVDEYLKVIFNGENNSELTYVAIRELPQNLVESNEPFPGVIIYNYPKEIKDDYYGNRIGNVITANNVKYLVEVGVKKTTNSDSSDLYIKLAILTFLICWVLWIIWSIMNVYEQGYLNTIRCILLILTGIIGYLVLSFSFNLNILSNNTRSNILYNSIFGFISISIVSSILLILFYIKVEPYRVKRLLDFIFQ